MKNTFINENGEIVAKGEITLNTIDLIFNDGTRYYSTSTVTLELLKSIGIFKEQK